MKNFTIFTKTKKMSSENENKIKEKSIKFLDWFMGDDENSCPFDLYKDYIDNKVTTEELYNVFDKTES